MLAATLAVVLAGAGVFLFTSVGEAGHGAEPILVGSSEDADFASIQDAINHSSPGDTILVEDGTYSETLLIDTNESGVVLEDLTIEANATDATVDGSAEGTTVVDIQAPDVTFDGIDVLWTGSVDEDVTAIRAAGSGTIVDGVTVELPAEGCSPSLEGSDCGPNTAGVRAEAGTTIRDSAFEAQPADAQAATWAIISTTAEQVVVEDVSLQGWTVGVMARADNTVVRNSAFDAQFTGVQAASDHVRVENSDFLNGNSGVYVANTDEPQTDIILRHNDFAGITASPLLFNASVQDAEVDAQLNHWGVVGEDEIEQTRVENSAGNDADVKPYFDADGDEHPQFPRVSCWQNGALTFVDTAITFQAALDLELPEDCEEREEDDGVRRHVRLFDDIDPYDGGKVSDLATIAGGTVQAVDERPAVNFTLGSDDSEIRNVDIEAFDDYGVKIEDASDVVVSSISVEGTTDQFGVSAESDAHGLLVEDSDFEGLDTAVHVSQTDRATLEDLVIVNSESAIQANFADSVTVDDVTAQNVDLAVSLSDAEGSTVQSSELLSDQDGIRADVVSDVRLVGNEIVASGTAIDVDGSGVIADNVIASVDASGDSTGVIADGALQIEGNSISDLATGLAVNGDNSEVLNNAFTDVGTAVDVSADGVSVEDNEVVDGSLGLDISGSAVSTSDNTFTGTREAIVADSSSMDLAFEADSISGADTAISIAGSDSVTIEDAVVTAADTGIELLADDGDQPSDLTVTNTHLETAGTALELGSGTQSVQVDAECNDWGAYHALMIEERIDDQGTDNSVDYQPWQAPTPELTLDFGCLVEPVAEFTYSPGDPSRADDVQFSDQSRDGSYQIVEWNWDFGDGNTSTAQNPTHSYEDFGTYEVTLTVTDANGQTSNTSQTIFVQNRAPDIHAPSLVDVVHTENVDFAVEGESREGDNVHLSADNSSAAFAGGANFTVNESTQDTTNPQGAFTWETEATDRGLYEPQFIAEDQNGDAFIHTIQLIVTDDAPVIEPLGHETTRLNQTLEFDVNAQDDNGDIVNLTAENLPDGATFTVEEDTSTPTGTFNWTPNATEDVGNHTITFQANASGLVTEETVPIHVGPENVPPEFTITLDGEQVGDTVTALNGETLNFNVTVEDGDGPDRPIPTVSEDPDIDASLDVLSIEGSTHEQNWTIDAEYTWEVPDVFTETVDVTFSADDGIGPVDVGLQIDVEHAPDVEAQDPFVADVSEVHDTVLVGEEIWLRTDASDIDDDLKEVKFVVDGEEYTAVQHDIDELEHDHALVSNETITADTAGDLDVEIVATDDQNHTTVVQDTIEIVANEGPTAAVENDNITVSGGIAPVTLDASPSAHPEDRPLTVSWNLPAVGTGIIDGEEATWIPPARGEYAATATVTDHLGAQDTVDIDIIVEDAVLGHASLVSHPEGEVGTTERPVLSLWAVDEAGAPLANAHVELTTSHGLFGELNTASDSTSSEGVFSASVPFDTGTQPGVNFVGDHQLDVVVSTPSDFGPTPPVIQDTIAIPYTVVAP